MSSLCLQSPAGPTDRAVLGRGPANARVLSRNGPQAGGQGPAEPQEAAQLRLRRGREG